MLIEAQTTVFLFAASVQRHWAVVRVHPAHPPTKVGEKGGEKLYITLNDIIQLLSLLIKVVTALFLALELFKSNKK